MRQAAEAAGQADRTRVLLVSPVGEHGGAEQVFLALARHLPALDVDPVLACMRPGPLTELARRQGLPVYSYRPHRYRDVHRVALGVLWLHRLIRRQRIDLVHSNHAAHLYSSPAARLSRRPELWHIHDYPYGLDTLGRLILKMPADFVLFTTRKVASGFPKLQARPHAVVLPVCTELDDRSSRPVSGDLRAKYGLSAGPLLLTVARLQAHKGHQYLVDAVPDVLRQFPSAAFVIVGKASDAAEQRLRQELQARCVHLGVAANVHFLGYVPDEDLAGLYREADALVHPALTEGFGLTLLDAMSAGVPVIAAAADGPSEFVVSEENGLLVPTADTNALGATIIRLLQSKELAAKLRAEGRRFAASLSPKEMVRDTAMAYRQVLRRG